MRLISKVKPVSIQLETVPPYPKLPWRAQHEDGTVTFHKTLKDAKAFVRFTYKWEVEDDQ